MEVESQSSEEDEFQAESHKERMHHLKAKHYDGEEEIVYDKDMAELFEKVEPGEGDEFAAVKPWLGAIKKPTHHPKINPDAPADDLEIDWVYGYRNEEAR